MRVQLSRNLSKLHDMVAEQDEAVERLVELAESQAGYPALDFTLHRFGVYTCRDLTGWDAG